MLQKKQLSQRLVILVFCYLLSTNLLAQPVFSIKPLALIYQSISGQSEAPGEVILSPNKNLHDISFAMADIQKISQGDVIYWLGAKASPELEKMRQRFSDKAWRSLQQDAHSWLNPKQLPALIDAMVTAMSAENPSEREHYWQRASALKKALAKQFEQAKNQWENARPSILMGHSAFEPMLEYLGLDIFEYYQGHSHGGQQTGFKDKAKILQRLQNGEINCALEEPDVSFAALAKRFASLKRITLEPMAKNIAYNEQGFLTFMQHNLQQLQLCQP